MNNCYTCKFKGTVPGSAHSSCGALSHIIENKEEAKAMEFLISLGMKTLTKEDGSPAVELDFPNLIYGLAPVPKNKEYAEKDGHIYFLNSMLCSGSFKIDVKPLAYFSNLLIGMHVMMNQEKLKKDNCE
jgi:hypothetical protein